MNTHHLTLLLLLLIVPGSNSVAQQLSHKELLDILRITSWRVPMPKDESLEWSIGIVDYAPRKYAKLNTSRLNRQQRALIDASTHW